MTAVLLVCATIIVAAVAHVVPNPSSRTLPTFQRNTNASVGVAPDELTKVYLLPGIDGGPWRMEGEGPHWVQFAGGVSGLRFKVGDEFAVQYINNLEEPTIIHAHGLTPPHGLDGVPFVDAPPIPPGRTAVYRYALNSRNVGSYWLHSHYGFHHELGLAIPLVIDGPMPLLYPLAREIDEMADAVVFLEDYCGYTRDDPDGNPDCMDPQSVYDDLRAAWEDDSRTFNYSECLAAATGEDTWDVGYRAHLANGRTASDPAIVLLEEGTHTLRVRIISAADTTNYRVDLGELVGTLIATDGQPCHPISKSVFWVAVAQRLDIAVELPNDRKGAYPIFAVVEGDEMDTHVLQSVVVLVVGGSGSAPRPGTYSTRPKASVGMMRGAEVERDHRAWSPLPIFGTPIKRFELNLTGDNGFMGINRASWQLPPMVAEYTANPHPMLVETGDRVCILLRNFNSDSHPFHLHGHVFEIVKIGGVLMRGAMRDSAIVDPGECAETEICFEADNAGVWPIHCHMTYHLAAGMLTTIEYTSYSTTSPDTKHQIVSGGSNHQIVSGADVNTADVAKATVL
eukprot:m.177718 g.177718  ORF g.177718 m.177718 type:complete len:567 (+) comp31907_c0_seq1:160-1860(+)